MQRAIVQLLDYIEKITGLRPHPSGAPNRMLTLPLFIRDRYHLIQTRILGTDLALAIESRDWDQGSAGEYAAHAASLTQQLGEPVALVLARAPSHLRNRLVQSGVPFIVPGNQFFVPFLAADLREWIPRLKSAPKNRLSAVAQLLIIFHLRRESLEGVSLQKIAKRLGYSPMMISAAKDELESADLVKPVRQQRSLTLRFPARGKDLWSIAEPKLDSPVRKTYWVQWEKPDYPALLAGLSALSRKSMLEDDQVRTYALDQSNVRRWLEKGTFRGAPGPHEATTRIEAWMYNPLLLGDKMAVDDLSLFLSLRDSPDDRVQQQLKNLIDAIPW
ncbi:MAG TPA: hypothetical protein VFA51_09095 [Candidatus Udaeobacter sp.]|nr:hypothetical protein [Candidatus Udaeobacter sp.]